MDLADSPDSHLAPAAPANQFDLGYTGDQINNQPAGTFNLQSIVFNALNAPVGTYTITLDRAVMSTPLFTDVPMSASFTVNVVPEPTTVGLAVSAAGCCWWVPGGSAARGPNRRSITSEFAAQRTRMPR